jgi:hypothetical protein
VNRAQQQGTLDGFCGLYALVHFLRHQQPFTGFDEPPERLAFWTVLEAAYQLRLLTPHYVYHGYESQNLRSIVDKIIVSLELPYTTHALWRAKESVGTESFFDLADRALAKGGRLIASHSRGDHWVLVKGSRKDALLIDNSGGTSPKDQELTRRQCDQIKLFDGILILPVGKSLAEV